jgi:hypothetical protein
MPQLSMKEKGLQITIPAQWINPSSDLDEKMRRTITEDLRRQDIEDNMKAFESQLADLPQMVQPVLDSDIGRLIWKARSKSVAHYDVVRTGGDWKLWRVEGITFGDLDRYFDGCTAGVEALARLVRGQAFQFPETRDVARDYASDYVDALVEGLRSNKNKALSRDV